MEINESRGAVGSPRIISFIRHRQFQQSCLRLSTPFNNQLVQPTGAAQLGAQVVAGAAQVGPQVETGAAQLGAHDEPQAEPQQRGLQRRILGAAITAAVVVEQTGLGTVQAGKGGQSGGNPNKLHCILQVHHGAEGTC